MAIYLRNTIFLDPVSNKLLIQAIKFKTSPKKKLSKNDVRRMKTLIDNNNKIGKKTSSSNIISSLHLNVVRSTVCKELKFVKYSYHNLPNFLYLIKTS